MNGVSILTSSEGAIPVYGYQLSSSAISGPIGTITASLAPPYIPYSGENTIINIPPNILYPIYYPLKTGEPPTTFGAAIIDDSAMQRAYNKYINGLKVNPYCSQY